MLGVEVLGQCRCSWSMSLHDLYHRADHIRDMSSNQQAPHCFGSNLHRPNMAAGGAE